MDDLEVPLCQETSISTIHWFVIIDHYWNLPNPLLFWVFGRIGSLLVSPVSLFHQTRVLSALLSQTTPQEAASFIGSRWVGDPSREKTHFLSKLKPIFDESIVSLSLLSRAKSSRRNPVVCGTSWWGWPGKHCTRTRGSKLEDTGRTFPSEPSSHSKLHVEYGCFFGQHVGHEQVQL